MSCIFLTARFAVRSRGLLLRPLLGDVAGRALRGQGGAVTQHKCGTCRYFEEGGFAGSGRCGHPLRKNIQQMVLVRKSELACRTDWANDLWEGKEDAEPVPISSSPRFNPEELNGDIKRQYTDRVTAVSVATASNSSPDRGISHERQAPPQRPAEVRRETPVERSAPEQSSSGPLRHVASSRVTDEPTVAPHPPRIDRPDPHDVARPFTPVTSNRPTSSSAQIESRSWDAQPEPPRSAPRSEPAPERRNPTPSFEPPLSSRVPEGRPSSPSRPPVQQTAAERIATRHAEATAAERPPIRRETSPSRPVTERPTTPPAARPTFGSVPESRTPSDELPRGRSGWTEPFAVAKPEPDSAPPTEDSRAVQAKMQPAAEAPSVPVRPPTTAAQTSMRECCATCRDFRPAEGGERGWCNNQYAFDHRQMVDRNELSCRGTIGNWWIASDDWWLQKADISHHGRPTPIVDDLLRQLLDNRMANARRRAGRS